MAPGEYECWGHFAEPWGLKAYVTWMTVAVFLLPALIITICQVILAAAGCTFNRLVHEEQLPAWLRATLSKSGARGTTEILFCFHEGCIWQALFDILLRTVAGVR